MNKRIKKKLSKRGGYKKYKNWNSWTQMKAWAKAIDKMTRPIHTYELRAQHDDLADAFMYSFSAKPLNLPSVDWGKYNEQTPKKKTP